MRHADFAVHLPSPAGTLTAWFPGASTTGRGAGPYCLPIGKQIGGRRSARSQGSTGIPDLDLFNRLESLSVEVKNSFLVVAQRWPGGGEKLQGQTPSD